MSSIPLPFGSNNIQVYAYEGFDFTIVNPPGTSNPPVSNSSGLTPQSLYFTYDGSGNVLFKVSDLSSTLITSTRPESFTITAVDGATSVNTVTINPGRFLDPNRNSLFGRSFIFYKNEAIRDTLGYPLRLVAPSFELKQPTSFPTLPPGLSFVKIASNIYDISGVPSVTVPNSNYQIIGVQQGGSKVVTAQFNMLFSNERIQIKADNSNITNMQIDTEITPCIITSIPPNGTSEISYTFPVFPDGITVRDISGTIRTSPTIISNTDPSYTLIISGKPTEQAAYAFKNANIDASGIPFTFTATRTTPPLVRSSKDITLAFSETVLFDQITVPPLYVDVPLDPSSIFFRAQSYFNTSNNISNITALSLPPGLSLDYTPGSDRAYLTGTPSVVSSGNYTIQAVNSNSKTRDYTVPITITQDIVTFIPPTTTDVCFNFVLSKPVSSSLPGYYPSNIQFVAQAASRLPVTLSAPALAGTGLSLDSNGMIVGIPTTVKPLTDLTVTATVIGSPATTSKTVKFAILNDQFTFGSVDSSNFNFVENVAITPFQIPVTTLSGRNVIDFAQSNLPIGLSISPAGVISGIPSQSFPISGSFTITPTTGYASGSNVYNYTLTPDTILFTVPQDSYSFIAGQTVNIQVTGTAYSGLPVRDFSLNLPLSYGLTISPNEGLLGGMWTNSLPPNQVLPSSCNFDITAKAGNLTETLPVSFTANPVLEYTSYLFYNNGLWRYNGTSWNQFTSLGALVGANMIRIKNESVDANFILGTYSNRIFSSYDASNFTTKQVSSDGNTVLSSLICDSGGASWWVGGSEGAEATIRRSIDNGLSWFNPTPIRSFNTNQPILSRDSNRSYSCNNPYLLGGVALARFSNIILAGGLYGAGSGTSMLRSVDDPNQLFQLPLKWVDIPTGFAMETAYINVDSPTVWVATGSDLYATKDFAVSNNYMTDLSSTNTIKYSTDLGVTWSNANGGFDTFGYEIVYANNSWLATGVTSSFTGQNRFVPELRYSKDGSNWTLVDLSTNPLFSPFTDSRLAVAPMPIGSMNYDGSNWNVFVQREISAGNYVTEIYSSPTVDSGVWTVSNVSDIFPPSSSPLTELNKRVLSYTRSQWLRPSANDKIITITMNFATGIGNGPQITNPSDSLLLYQYVPVSIEVSSDDPSALLFISDANLPPGLEFNPITGFITGSPAQQGIFTTPVYAKNTSGVTLQTIKFNIIVPRVIRKQDGASAYTSLLKQYTEVLAAQSARDTRVLPAQERRLGEFMSPVPAAVTTAVLPTIAACLVCRRVDCKTVTQISIDGGGDGGASLETCDFLDGNTDNPDNGVVPGNAESVCE